MKSQDEKLTVKTHPYLCEFCGMRYRKADELFVHNTSITHKIEMLKRKINSDITQIQIDLWRIKENAK